MDAIALLSVERIEEVELPPWQASVEVLGAAGVQDIALPDGAGYGGADTWSGMSADETLYAVLCVERPGRKFGTYAFRLFRDGRKEWLALQEFTEGRVTASEEPPRGVFLSWLAPGNRVLKRAQLPGFVSPLATGVATPIQVVPTAPDVGGGGSSGSADTEGRIYTSQVKKELGKRIDELLGRVKILEARPDAAAFDEKRIDHHIWEMIMRGEAVYALLAADNPGIVGQIRRIIAEAPRSA